VHSNKVKNLFKRNTTLLGIELPKTFLRNLPTRTFSIILTYLLDLAPKKRTPHALTEKVQPAVTFDFSLNRHLFASVLSMNIKAIQQVLNL
jgi:hypothetical protein